MKVLLFYEEIINPYFFESLNGNLFVYSLHRNSMKWHNYFLLLKKLKNFLLHAQDAEPKQVSLKEKLAPNKLNLSEEKRYMNLYADPASLRDSNYIIKL